MGSASAAVDIFKFLPESADGRVDGLYVHIPFCFHKCHYCDFYSITRQTPERMSTFVDRLARELEHWKNCTGVRTIFFGGGTPTLLPVPAMSQLLRALRDGIDLTRVDEWTVEANPATLTAEMAQVLRQAGVNRLSFGAQSFDRSLLQTLERHHEPEQVRQSLGIARDAGFERLNVDLIYGIPGQTMAQWQNSLEQAIALGTEHLSCYGLTYEPNTPMAVKKRLGIIRAVDEDAELAMLRYTRHRLRDVGLPPYEISNYARPGSECRHNLMYWSQGSYIGLGPSAASHMRGVRWKNQGHLGAWERAVDANQLPAEEVERLSERQRAGELAYLQLRLSRGVTFDAFSQHSGLDARHLYAEKIAQLQQLGLIHVDASGFALTEKGVEVTDAVAQEFVDP